MRKNLPLTDDALTVDKCKCDICKCLLSSPPPGGSDDHVLGHLGFTLITTTMLGWNLGTCSATRSPKNLETGWRLRESVTMMRLMGEIVKRRMLNIVFFTAFLKFSLRSVVLARLITTMARLIWWADG